MPIDREYKKELERLESEHEGLHEEMICSRCHREFKATVEPGFKKPEKWICPICEEDADILD